MPGLCEPSPIELHLKSQTFLLRETQVAAVCIGGINLPVVLCLHGWLDNAASFTPLMNAVQQCGLTSFYRFVCIDLPGHGHSEHKVGAYHFADWIDDVYQLINQVGKQPVILLGHSLGALIASCVAAAFPEKIKALIMIEGAGPLVQPVESTTSHLRRALQSRHKIANVHPRALSALVQAKQRALSISSQHAELLVTRGISALEGGYVWRHDPKLTHLSPFRLSEAQAQQLIQDIACPTFCILGDAGYVEIKQLLTQRRRDFKQLTTRELTGNHHLHMVNNQGVAQAIKEFLVKL